MIVQTQLLFRERRDPFPYDMTATGGTAGTSYSIDVIDFDECKVKVKCSEPQWNSLNGVARNTPILAVVESTPGNAPKLVSSPEALQILLPAKG